MTNADPIALIDQSLRVAIRAAFGEGFDDVDPILREAQKREFGDWQANVAMSLGKRLGKPPREVAETILDQVDFGDVVSESSIAGPGFINLRLSPSAVATLHDLLSLPLGVGSGGAQSLAFAPDGALLAVGRRRGIVGDGHTITWSGERSLRSSRGH